MKYIEPFRREQFKAKRSEYVTMSWKLEDTTRRWDLRQLCIQNNIAPYV